MIGRGKRWREANLARAEKYLDDGGWTKHTRWHWSRTLFDTSDGYTVIEYWPSTDKAVIDRGERETPMVEPAFPEIAELMGIQLPIDSSNP